MRIILISLLIVFLPLPLLAQQECVPDKPCAGIDWRMPQLPVLRTPTPMTTPAPNTTPEPTLNTGLLIPNTTLDASQLEDQMGTFTAILQSTPVAISDASGNYAATPDIDALGSDSSTWFGYVKGLGQINLGVITPLLLFMLTGFILTLSTRMVSLFLPIAAAVFGFFRKVIGLILDFLPL